MEQIIQTYQISKYNTTGTDAKQVMFDKQIILDNPSFENFGTLNIPKGCNDEYYEIKLVNYVFLNSECPFDLLIDNAVLISVKQFSFVNPYKTINLSIRANCNHPLAINFVYGQVQDGSQGSATKIIGNQSIQTSSWNKVVKNLKVSNNCQDDTCVCDIKQNYNQSNILDLDNMLQTTEHVSCPPKDEHWNRWVFPHAEQQCQNHPIYHDPHHHDHHHHHDCPPPDKLPLTPHSYHHNHNYFETNPHFKPHHLHSQYTFTYHPDPHYLFNYYHTPCHCNKPLLEQSNKQINPASTPYTSTTTKYFTV